MSGQSGFPFDHRTFTLSTKAYLPTHVGVMGTEPVATEIPSSEQSSSTQNGTSLRIIVVVSVALGSLIMLLLFARVLLWRRNRARSTSSGTVPSPLPELPHDQIHDPPPPYLAHLPNNNETHELSTQHRTHRAEIPLSHSNFGHELPVDRKAGDTH